MNEPFDAKDPGQNISSSECTKCHDLKNKEIRHSSQNRCYFRHKEIYPRRWPFLLALSSWHSVSVFLLVTLLSTWKGIEAQRPPPNYAHGNMPDTNFTCDHKTTGGYYADPEAGCQMFHVCVRISEDEIKDYKFLCPNNTVFDQKNFICTNWWEIECDMSTKYYNKNDLFKPTEAAPSTEKEYEYVEDTGNVYYETVYEYVDPEPPSAQVDTSRHRLSLGKNTREEKSIELNARSENASPVVSSSVSISKPTTTFSTSSIKRTSVGFTEPIRTPQVTKSTYPTTATTSSSTSTTQRPVTTISSVTLQRVQFVPSNTPEKTTFEKTVIGQSVIEPAYQSESEDPFSNYDWRKKESVNLTPRSKDGGRTGSTDDRRRARNKLRSANRKGPRKPRRQNVTPKPEEANRKAKLSEFSNFRFYKTAFGVSYSSDDYFGSTTTELPSTTAEVPRARSVSNIRDPRTQEIKRNANPPNRGIRRFRKTDDQTAKSSHLRSKLRRRTGLEPNRRGRTASRTTRYSKYAR